MAADPISRAEFDATTKRLDQADAYNLLQLTNHIADYRREAIDMRGNVSEIDRKLDKLLESQSSIKGRDGVIFVLIMAAVTVLTTVIAASILGVIH